MKPKFTIGSRGSELALWQTNFVRAALEKHFPAISFEIKIIKTTGDRLLDVALSKIGDKGLFTRQIEAALLDGEIDLAVHSLKDLQTVQPEGLAIGAVSARETPNDVLISEKYASIDDLPLGAKVATGSLRRKSQLLAYRPDLQIFEIRGNVPTRLRKFAESDLDAMILAYAGVHRLNLDAHIVQIIPFEIMLPAVGQGAMAIEIRESDAPIKQILQVFNDENTGVCIAAERAFLRALEGGCQVPIGGHATLEANELNLKGFVGNTDGTCVMRDEIRGRLTDAGKLGLELARRMIENGASELLNEARRKAETAPKQVL